MLLYYVTCTTLHIQIFFLFVYYLYYIYIHTCYIEYSICVYNTFGGPLQMIFGKWKALKKFEVHRILYFF